MSTKVFIDFTQGYSGNCGSGIALLLNDTLKKHFELSNTKNIKTQNPARIIKF